MSIAFAPSLALPSRRNPNLRPSLSSARAPLAVLDEATRQVSTTPSPPQTPWTPSSWRSRRALQQPTYPNPSHLASVENTLSRLPPLVSPGEMRALKRQLANVALGHGFVLQGGDCAEDLNESSEGVTDTVRALFKMAVVLMWGSQEPVVKIGRLAGQYGKPRSADTEIIDGIELPSYRGENINGAAFTPEARIPDPERMLLAYNRSAGTTNLVRALASGGFADLKRVKQWGMDWSMSTSKGREYMATAERIAEALHFMETCGVSQEQPVMTSTDVYTSHEGLLLPYEQALTRRDELTGEWYDCSGHFIWIGERTRDIDDAHVQFAKGIANPIGVKAGPTMKPEELLRLCDVLNPNNEPGRLTVITRMGADKILQGLPPLVRAIKREGRHVVWVSDSMHGNTFKADSGFKTRSWNRIMTEVRGFFAVHEAEGTKAGGLHFEMTGKEVTECVGGTREVKSEDLSRRYESLCDPRLNQSQALEMAFEAAEILRSQRREL